MKAQVVKFLSLSTDFRIMSFNVQTLKSATDDQIPSFLRTPENGTTTAIRHNTIYEFGLIGKGARIVNNDPTANLNVRLHNPRATPMIVPPSSELPIEEWFSEIHCEPDAATGDFQLTLELAFLNDASRLKRKR